MQMEEKTKGLMQGKKKELEDLTKTDTLTMATVKKEQLQLEKLKKRDSLITTMREFKTNKMLLEDRVLT
jgi:hypothetical protein